MRLNHAFKLVLLLTLFALPVLASDHLEAVNNNEDQNLDINDSYLFLDPNDNTRVVLILTTNGFIVPSQLQNQFAFSPTGRYNFEIENTGDAVPDQYYRVTFSTKTGAATPQTATIELPNGRTFTAPVTPSTIQSDTAAAPVLTTDAVSNIIFYAGIQDDPFFHDIVGFGRFTASARAGAPVTSHMLRGRDSFAGYNTHTIALSIPVAQLRGTNGNMVGLSVTTQRRIVQFIGPGGRISGSGRWVNSDRFGIPTVNTVVVPFARKNEYNFSNTTDDAAGKFANDIIAQLKLLGTNDANIGLLAGVAVLNGDIMRLDTSVANTGPQGGTSAGAAFPNGRRPLDDVVDTVLFFVVNQNVLGDGVPANDVAYRDVFPFVAPPHQPLPAGAQDGTKN